MRRHTATAAAAAALILAVLGGCTTTPGTAAPTSTGSGSTAPASTPVSTPPSTGPTSPTTALAASTAAAISLVPAGVDNFTITDQLAAKTRWGVPEVNSTTDRDSPEFTTYLQKSLKSAAIGRMVNYAVRMAEDWGWGGFDVVWEVDIDTGGAPVAIYRLRDDLDMSIVTGSLDKYFTRSGPDSRPVYKADLKKSGGITPFFDATVIPDQHLIIGGPAPESILALVDGGGSSVANDPATRDLIAAVGPADVIMVRTGAEGCTDPLGALGNKATPAALEELKKRFADSDLAQPLATVLALTDDTNGVVVAEYADAATASAEVETRKKLLTEGTSVATRQPYTELVTITSIAATDRLLRYDLAGPKGSYILFTMAQRRDDPWAYCPLG